MHDLYVGAHNISWPYIEDGKTLFAEIKGSIKANNGDIIREMALGGAGISMAPAMIVGSDISKGKLIPVLEDYEVEPINIYAVYPHNRHLSAKVRLFVDFLKGWISECPAWEDHDKEMMG